MRAFIDDPTEPERICNWYGALAKNCPLWSLQDTYYHQWFDVSKLTPLLFDDIAFGLMVRPSRDQRALKKFLGLHLPPPVFELDSAKDQTVSFARLPKSASPTQVRFAPRYLVQTYRFALMSSKPGQTRLRRLWNALMRARVDELGPVFWQPPIDYKLYGFGSFERELYSLVVERDLLPSGSERKAANDRIKEFLKDTRVLRGPGNKATIPNREWFVRTLAAECLVWLPLCMECKHESVSAKATTNLASWGCGADPESWARRLAFPFLSKQELRNVESPLSVQLVVAYLIHARANSILKLNTVADDAFGATFVRNNLRYLRTNPFLK